MKILIGLMMVFLASEVFAAQAICVAQAKAPRTRSRVQTQAFGGGNVRVELKQACRRALRQCRRKAFAPRNCKTVRAVVKFPGLEGKYRFGGRGGRGRGGRRF